ncbi:MAG: hypothetical protein OEZ06_32510 [Myxococcales bacterium]|nr:hypothetical protein [Myxococcales bacterium]
MVEDLQATDEAIESPSNAEIDELRMRLRGLEMRVGKPQGAARRTTALVALAGGTGCTGRSAVLDPRGQLAELCSDAAGAPFDLLRRCSGYNTRLIRHRDAVGLNSDEMTRVHNDCAVCCK